MRVVGHNTALILLVSGSIIHAQSPSPGFGLTMAVGQPGAPVGIVAVRSTTTTLFEQVRVRNLSSQTIVAIRFGVFVTPQQAGTGAPRTLDFAPMAVDIAPTGEQNLVTLLLTRAEADRLLTELRTVNAVADLGLAQVDFADGTSWTFQTDPLNGFRPREADLAALRLAQPARACAAAGRPAPADHGTTVRPELVQQTDGYFSCQSSLDCLVCTNSGPSCIISVCGSYGQKPCSNCPQQQCFYHP